ncbi:nucleoside-diphosphate-sugar epimerase [Actinoplanes lutulentus]|uniref:Nucleoside-diphosphate-sugar epimerase n=1 Tax=Actinoplanes lutulentus TaxID=1287878 RepID=A0A327Z2J5_9ACTN|nr:SDR family oxidoreductase [Actinoplanes lutulentus]MBB2940341.1 nucleoside-diphosphate-sugar epimerase [Actinoplanes lutulentus]RAK28834.1 nucleoside-diphosphate-sugar epimerase [Actinoplanes lutulentus]
MRVFVTGASGWIGSHTVDELLRAGHDVTGLARSDAAAAALRGKGAAVLRGDLDDLDALRRGATEADAVVNLANKHDWANPAESNRAERASVEAIAEALAGTDKPFVFASGLAALAQGRPSTENDPSPFSGLDSPRGGAENRAFELGVHAIAARFAPTVHGTGDHGFIAILVAAAKRTGFAGYVGDGSSAWSAVHVDDAARLVRIGLEQAPAGTRLHAVAEEAVPSRQIAEAIGRSLDLPVKSVAPDDAVEHFGFLGRFFALDMSASSEITRAAFGWEPTGPTLVEDIIAGAYKNA